MHKGTQITRLNSRPILNVTNDGNNNTRPNNSYYLLINIMGVKTKKKETSPKKPLNSTSVSADDQTIHGTNKKHLFVGDEKKEVFNLCSTVYLHFIKIDPQH